jgi:uncharacterized protein YsxB (DUF464 family)
MTKVLIDMENGILQAMGHANYAPHGQDVVCAGVSALTQMAALQAEKKGGMVMCGDAVIHAECDDQEYKQLLRAVADAVREMEKQYPNHVHLVLEEG